MKTAILLTILFFGSLCYSQEAVIKQNSQAEYSFSHSKSMDQTRIDRYTSRMLSECHEMESIKFIDQTCIIKLKKNLSAEKINEAILYCISKFGYITYKLEEK